MSIPATQVNPHELKLCFTIDEFVRASRIGRTKVYEALKEGRLAAIKSGCRTLILESSAREFLSSLPAYHPQSLDTEAV
jgi:hypothetical protein